MGAAAVAQAAPPEPVPSTEPVTEPATAGEWYARGIELGTAGEFADAAAAFLRSHALQPTSEALFNAALAYENAEQTIAAVETYGRFLADPNRNEALTEAAERSTRRLERKLGVLKAIHFDPDRPPSALYVDGTLRTLDELPLLLEPGAVVIEVVNELGDARTETYELAAGEALVVDVRALLRPVPVPVPVPVPDIQAIEPVDDGLDQRLAQRAKQLRTATWIGLGSSAAIGIAAATLAGLAVREGRAYTQFTCVEFPGGRCPDGFEIGDPSAHLRAFEDFRLAARITAGVAGGLALGTLVVGLLSVRAKRQANRANPRVQLTPGMGSFTLRF
jgi:tetratricopeptide (TPR) repeat protein